MAREGHSPAGSDSPEPTHPHRPTGKAARSAEPQAEPQAGARLTERPEGAGGDLQPDRTSLGSPASSWRPVGQQARAGAPESTPRGVKARTPVGRWASEAAPVHRRDPAPAGRPWVSSRADHRQSPASLPGRGGGPRRPHWRSQDGACPLPRCADPCHGPSAGSAGLIRGSGALAPPRPFPGVDWRRTPVPAHLLPACPY